MHFKIIPISKLNIVNKCIYCYSWVSNKISHNFLILLCVLVYNRAINGLLSVNTDNALRTQLGKSSEMTHLFNARSHRWCSNKLINVVTLQIRIIDYMIVHRFLLCNYIFMNKIRELIIIIIILYFSSKNQHIWNILVKYYYEI